MFGDFSLAHKIVVVTGGASGIGFAFTKLAVSSGAKVIIADLKLLPDSEKLVKNSSTVCFFKCNVRNWSELEAIVEFSESAYGDVPDVYVANAGLGESNRSGFWSDTEKQGYALLDVNLVHPIKLTRIAIQALTSRNKKGVVLITSSVAGVNGHFGTPLYVASKHGTIGLIKSLAAAETEANVKVVGICPGLVATPLLAGIVEGKGAEVEEGSVLIQAEEIAGHMKDLIEQGKYYGGTALGVYRPGSLTVAADGSYSELELLAPSNFADVKRMLGNDGK